MLNLILLATTNNTPFNDALNTLEVEKSSHQADTFSTSVQDSTVTRVMSDMTIAPHREAYLTNSVSEVAQYLAKPVPVASITWTTGDSFTTMLNGIDGTDAWAYVSSNTMWRDKLRGFLGLRSKLCFRLELNGTPFHAGRLRLCYYPAADVSFGKWKSHIGSIVSLSQLPGADVEANESSVTVAIPYVSVAHFIEMNAAPVRSHGRIFVTVMSPLRTGVDQPQNIQGRLWAWHEDVELFGQNLGAITQGPVVTQGPETQKPQKKSRGRVAPSDAEEKPVSTFFAGASQSVGALSAIPSLAPYTGPTAWALSLLSGAASALGWSKPIANQQISRVSNNPFANVANYNGVDPAHVLALDADAKLQAIDTYSPDGMDEASISYIKKQFALYQVTPYATTSTSVDPFINIPLAPANLKLISGPTAHWHTPVSYLGNLFTMYRGGFKVKFKISKTALHRGKLQVSFVPGIDNVSPTLVNTAFAYRTIIDLAEGDEFCFSVPYILPLEFLDVALAASRIYVHAITPLQAPNTVSNAVDISVYIAGADDLQFQHPRVPNTEPIVVEGPVWTEGPDDLVNTGPIVCSPVGGDAPDPSLDVAFSSYAASEQPSSVLQLIKRYNHLEVTENVGAIYHGIYPWGLSAQWTGVNPVTKVPRNRILSFVMSPYAFMRGSMKIRVNFPSIETATNSTKTKRLWAGLKPGRSNVIWDNGVDAFGPFGSSNGIVAFTDAAISAGGLSAAVPYQSFFAATPVRYYKEVTDQPHPEAPYGKLVISAPTEPAGYSQAVGDDFQPLFFVGVPRHSTY